MHNLIVIVFLIFSFLVTACSNQVKHESSNNITVVDKSHSVSGPEYGQIIFGKYCGFCGSNCTDMFQYNLKGNATTLLADTTDGFMKHGKFQFNWYLTQEQHSIANAFVENIPSALKTTSDTLTRFGCPDCADQCGLYLETADYELNNRKKFYFDTDTAQVPQELRSFVTQLYNTVNRLKQN